MVRLRSDAQWDAIACALTSASRIFTLAVSEVLTVISVNPLRALCAVTTFLRPAAADTALGKKELKIAVRDLVAHELGGGDLAFDFFSPTRPLEAMRIHQQIQQSRPPDYQAEVPVSHRVETELFALTIGGRIDGLYPEREPVLVEEIKTTTAELEHIAEHENPVHWGQVKCYAYIYALDHGLESIDAQLTYCQINTGEIRQFRHSFVLTDLETFFNHLVAGYLQWAQTIVSWRLLRESSIAELSFPYPRYRPGQRDMAVAVYRAIRDDGQLLIQAATGIGKTMAAVFPAVKALGENLTEKIFYLTARTTGRVAAEKALDELRGAGLKLKSLTLTAKDKICFNPDSTCDPEECEFARGHYDRLNDALNDMFRQDDFTRQAVEEIAGHHRVCPFEFSLQLSLWADCVICDYNYAFDPRVFLRRFFLEEKGRYTFLIDEAHNLVDRSREMFSAEIFKQSFLDVRRAMGKRVAGVYRSSGRINTWMVRTRKKCTPGAPQRHEKQPPEELFPLLRKFLKTTDRWLAGNVKTKFREQLLELFFTVSGFMRVAEHYDDTYATCYEKMEKDLRLKLFCIDPSVQLEEALTRCQAAVFFSATMTPMAYFQKILGCKKEAARLILPSPFAHENFAAFVSDRISTLYRDREQTCRQVMEAICTLVSQKKGNYLVFFPSYEYMQLVAAAFEAACPGSEIMVQTPHMSEPEREAFLRCFSQDREHSLIGFAVMGGIFGEGIDLVGERLSGAVVVGVGLPAICLERELVREHFNATVDAGFEYAYQYPGINRVLQAAGRVIRDENDRGVVFLIDRRYSTSRYRRLLPETWQPVWVSNGRNLKKKLQQFWQPKS